jgi:hypothetical protein
METKRMAFEIETAENRIEEAVRNGMTLTEARVKYPYYTLQSKQ